MVSLSQFKSHEQPASCIACRGRSPLNCRNSRELINDISRGKYKQQPPVYTSIQCGSLIEINSIAHCTAGFDVQSFFSSFRPYNLSYTWLQKVTEQFLNAFIAYNRRSMDQPCCLKLIVPCETEIDFSFGAKRERWISVSQGKLIAALQKSSFHERFRC